MKRQWQPNTHQGHGPNGLKRRLTTTCSTTRLGKLSQLRFLNGVVQDNGASRGVIRDVCHHCLTFW
jgi:hypothetical protein